MEICKCLIEVKADPNAKSYRYELLSYVSQLFCCWGFCDAIVFRRCFRPFCVACACIHVLEFKRSTTHRMCSQNTPLHESARGGRTEICKFLVGAKADLAAKDRYAILLRARLRLNYHGAHLLRCSSNRTPLKVANESNKTDVAAFLRSIGAPA